MGLRHAELHLILPVLPLLALDGGQAAGALAAAAALGALVVAGAAAGAGLDVACGAGFGVACGAVDCPKAATAMQKKPAANITLSTYFIQGLHKAHRNFWSAA